MIFVLPDDPVIADEQYLAGPDIHGHRSTPSNQFTSPGIHTPALDAGLTPSLRLAGCQGQGYDAVIEPFWSRGQIKLLDRRR